MTRANVFVINPADLASLRGQAASLGLTIGRGRDAQMGSLRQMLELLAQGEAALFLIGSDEWLACAEEIRALSYDERVGYWTQQVLEAVALALERAGAAKKEADAV